MNISGACVQSKSKAVNKISTFNLVTHTVYPKKYAHDFCFAVLCCCYTLTDFPISIRLTSLALWQSNDCPSASKATLMNMDKYFMWIHYERLHNHNKAKHNKTVCIFLGIYCMCTTKIVDIYLTIVYATVYSDADLRKQHSSASLAFVPREFPAQMSSNAENGSIWWRHHAYVWKCNTCCLILAQWIDGSCYDSRAAPKSQGLLSNVP